MSEQPNSNDVVKDSTQQQKQPPAAAAAAAAAAAKDTVSSNVDTQDDDDDDDASKEETKMDTKNEGFAAAAAVNTASSAMEALPLDWTKLGVAADEAMPLRYPHNVAEISKNDLELCIVGTAGQKITVMGKDFDRYVHPKLKELVLRSHLISRIDGIQSLKELELLELYDNMVQELSCIEGCGPNLRVLDMSYNVIRDLSPVSICENLTELYIANNKLKQIQGLERLVKLRKIDLGANRIRVLENLDGLIHLEELWIGKNKIEKIQGLDKLTKLRRLDIQSNRLTKIENLSAQQNVLEELYLAHNGIDDDGAMSSSSGTGLALTFPKLTVLDLSRNRLTSTLPFAHQPALEELWISGNQIALFEDIIPLRDAQSIQTNLETLYLEYNPIASEFEYRKRLAEWLPSLKQIDATLIGGLAAHGLPSGAATATATTNPSSIVQPVSAEELLRNYQAAALQRAKEETREKQKSLQPAE